MKEGLRAEVISYNIDNMEICASAARISTTKGDAFEIFEKAKQNEKNGQLIQKVLRSGHKSVIEHAVFTIAFRNVSAFVEEFFIEHRLSSFTVKSRRYVDFGGFGYYIPPVLEGEERKLYCRYMDLMFESYKTMLEGGVPKEDARFLLPYAFNSNFYCTLNARELMHIIHDIRFGHGRGIPELQDLAGQMEEQVKAVFPCMDFEPGPVPEEGDAGKHTVGMDKVSDCVTLLEPSKAGAVRLLNGPADPLAILDMAYRMNHPEAEGAFRADRLIGAERPRELEQLSYSFLISNITLSGITHIVRHRMQSIIIPPIQGIDHSKCILPDTVKADSKMSETYRHTLETANGMMKQAGQSETLRQYGYYFALSGNVMDIMTTVNARELEHFFKLRTCNRAQWEIRDIAIGMLKALRGSFPELFSRFGPGCFVTGRCPEGDMTCGRKEEVREMFANLT